MKNVPTYYAKTLIIARIAATIIPTPIDFNNLIIFIRKQLFGGIGQNFMNPALAARCFLLISLA